MLTVTVFGKHSKIYYLYFLKQHASLQCVYNAHIINKTWSLFFLEHMKNIYKTTEHDSFCSVHHKQAAS